MADLDGIRERLDQVAEELADLAMARLRDSMAGDGQDAIDEEKRITRARRAVEKASALLAGPRGGW